MNGSLLLAIATALSAAGVAVDRLQTRSQKRRMHGRLITFWNRVDETRIDEIPRLAAQLCITMLERVGLGRRLTWVKILACVLIAWSSGIVVVWLEPGPVTSIEELFSRAPHALITVALACSLLAILALCHTMLSVFVVASTKKQIATAILTVPFIALVFDGAYLAGGFAEVCAARWQLPGMKPDIEAIRLDIIRKLEIDIAKHNKGIRSGEPLNELMMKQPNGSGVVVLAKTALESGEGYVKFETAEVKLKHAILGSLKGLDWALRGYKSGIYGREVYEWGYGGNRFRWTVPYFFGGPYIARNAVLSLSFIGVIVIVAVVVLAAKVIALPARWIVLQFIDAATEASPMESSDKFQPATLLGFTLSAVLALLNLAWIGGLKPFLEYAFSAPQIYLSVENGDLLRISDRSGKYSLKSVKVLLPAQLADILNRRGSALVVNGNANHDPCSGTIDLSDLPGAIVDSCAEIERGEERFALPVATSTPGTHISFKFRAMVPIAVECDVRRTPSESGGDDPMVQTVGAFLNLECTALNVNDSAGLDPSMFAVLGVSGVDVFSNSTEASRTLDLWWSSLKYMGFATSDAPGRFKVHGQPTSNPATR